MVCQGAAGPARQYLLPPLHAGWTVRRKSHHLRSYEGSGEVRCWAWTVINPMHALCGQVDFRDSAGLDCVRGHVETLLTKIKRKYKEYGINERPFVVVKPDAGACGMGILTVRDVKDVDAIVHAAGDAPHCGALLVQEGVPTYERMNDAVAEPVVYMIDRYVVGGSTASTPSAASTRTRRTRLGLRAAGLRLQHAAAAARREARRQPAKPLTCTA